jgi:hypothetical protein
VLPGAEYSLSTLYNVADVNLPENGDPVHVRREDANMPLAIVECLLSAKLADAGETEG